MDDSKRTLINMNLHKFTGYDKPLLSTVKEEFTNTCRMLILPDSQPVPPVHLVLEGTAKECLQKHIINVAQSVEQEFDVISVHFTTETVMRDTLTLCRKLHDKPGQIFSIFTHLH